MPPLNNNLLSAASPVFLINYYLVLKVKCSCSLQWRIMKYYHHENQYLLLEYIVNMDRETKQTKKKGHEIDTCNVLLLIYCSVEVWLFRFIHWHLIWRNGQAWYCHEIRSLKLSEVWLYVLVMSRMRFRVNLHSIVAWMSRNSLLETGAISEI